MTLSLVIVAGVLFGVLGLFGPVIAGAYLAVRLNRRSQDGVPPSR